MTVTVEDLTDDIRSAARGLAAQWPGVDPEDIAQEMTLKVLENWPGIAERATGYGAEDSEVTALAMGLARRRGLQYCSQERKEYQMSSGQWIYTPAEIRTLLPSLFDGLAWEDAPKRPSRGKEYLEADGFSILMMDLRTAYESIPERDQALILTTFREGVAIPNGSPERKRLNRAVDRMTEALNRAVYLQATEYHDGPGARAVVSNAHARFMTTDDYQGD